MAKIPTPPAIDPSPTVAIKRKKRATTSPKARRWTPEEARKMGMLSGGRPKGSTTRPIVTVSAFMLSVFLEPDFQAWFRWKAINGYLSAAEVQNLCYFAEGRPTYKVEVTKPVDPDEAADRKALLAMSIEERRAMTDSIRKFKALREAVAIPQTTQPVAEDAEIIAP